MISLRRILVIKLADLGDALLATAAIGALREAYPDARIDALTAPAGATVLHLCPDIDNVIVFDKAAFDSPAGLIRPAAPPRLARLATRLRLARYDAVVLLHHLTTRFGNAKFRALCLATGAPVRAGLDNGRGTFLTHRAADYGYGGAGMSELEYGLAVAGTLGADTTRRRPHIVVPEDATQEASALLRRHGIDGPFVVIHPSVGAFAPARNWDPDAFAEVAQALVSQHGVAVVLVGAEDAAAPATLIQQQVKAADLTGKTTVAQLAAVLGLTRLVLGSDSGVVHLAAAVDAPLVAVFGPSNPTAWRPYGSSVWQPGWPIPASDAVLVRAGIPCSPCFYTGYHLGRRNGCGFPTCLAMVTPEMITRIASHILDHQPALKSRN